MNNTIKVEKNIKISIIVPLYNVEEYLEECLESIRNQTYTDIEVILVNDGSTDGSKQICERFCQIDSRFRLINQENQGQSVARNRGFKESIGQYIMFVDSDDVIKIPTTVFEGNSKEAILNCIAFRTVKFCAFTKLYRREIVEKIPFLEGYIYEDVFTGINYLNHIRKIIVIDYIGYYYRVRPNSTMTKSFHEKDLDIFHVGEKLIESFTDNEYLLPYIGYFMFYLGISHYEKERINKVSPYVHMYENFIRDCSLLAKESQEVVREYRLLRLYLIAPKYFLTITHPVYQFIYKGWKKFRILVRKI